jgi:hypothetical protein
VKRAFVGIVVVFGCGGGREPAIVVLPKNLPESGGLDIVDSGKAMESDREVLGQSLPSSFLRCDVIRGRLFACSGAAEGRAVLEQDDGIFRGCDLAAGRLLGCGGWASGVVAVFDGGLYLACHVEHGRVLECRGPYDGPTVVERERRH